MNCQEALEQVYLYLDGEMCEVDCASFIAHIDDCTPCLQEFGVEQQVKALVSRCCGGEQASAELKSQVLQKLRTFAPDNVAP